MNTVSLKLQRHFQVELLCTMCQLPTEEVVSSCRTELSYPPRVHELY